MTTMAQICAKVGITNPAPSREIKTCVYGMLAQIFESPSLCSKACFFEALGLDLAALPGGSCE